MYTTTTTNLCQCSKLMTSCTDDVYGRSQYAAHSRTMMLRICELPRPGMVQRVTSMHVIINTVIDNNKTFQWMIFTVNVHATLLKHNVKFCFLIPLHMMLGIDNGNLCVVPLFLNSEPCVCILDWNEINWTLSACKFQFLSRSRLCLNVGSWWSFKGWMQH